MLNLAVMLEDSARNEPDRDAIVSGSQRLTYRQVESQAAAVAQALAAKGIGRGDRVALSCPNLPYFPIVYYGIVKSGAAVVPLNVLLTDREIEYYLADSQAKAYFCFAGTPELPMGERGHAAYARTETCEHFVVMPADPSHGAGFDDAQTLAQLTERYSGEFGAVPTRETDTAVVLYTSGTTGQPKGAELSHSNMVQNAQICKGILESAADDVHLVALPLFHSFGQTVNMHAAFQSAGTLVLLPRFDPDSALGAMQSEKVTVFAGVPTMYWALLNHPNADSYDLKSIASTLRRAVCGGSALPREVMLGFEHRFEVPILEGYGLSESSPVATFSRIDRPRRVGSIGFPVWGTEAKIMTTEGREADIDEPGEVWLKGHHIMTGYLNRPEETAAVIDSEGWFRTGDIGTKDKDGYFYIVDRLKEMVIRNGLNVYPREVEEVMLTHPDVSLVAVIGVPNDQYGEEIKAYVIRKPDSVLREDALIDWCRENMAAYKHPRIVEFRQELPMTATGKILKRELMAE